MDSLDFAQAKEARLGPQDDEAHHVPRWKELATLPDLPPPRSNSQRHHGHPAAGDSSRGILEWWTYVDLPRPHGGATRHPAVAHANSRNLLRLNRRALLRYRERKHELGYSLDNIQPVRARGGAHKSPHQGLQ